MIFKNRKHFYKFLLIGFITSLILAISLSIIAASVQVGYIVMVIYCIFAITPIIIVEYNTYEPDEPERIISDYINPHGIIDDNNYLNGKYRTFDPDMPFIIVTGERAIGKSQYSKVMSSFNRGVQYYSCQRYALIDKRLRDKAIEHIGIIRNYITK